MYIKRIEIQNIRGLPPLNLDLERKDGSLAGITVIAGPNGSGKTTLLQALALAVYGEDINPYPADYWLRRGEVEASVRLELDATAEGFSEHQSTSAEYSLTSGKIQEYRPDPLDDRFGSQPGWFLAGYGPLRRLSKTEEEAFKPALLRCRTLMKDTFTLTETVRWLKDLNHASLEGDTRSKGLESHMLTLLSEGLLPGGLQPKGINSKGLVVTDGTVEFTLAELSDGYRTVIAVVIDLIRQMNEAFQGVQFCRVGEYWCCPHEGVVLIDEIDTHLHPSWQQNLGFWLKNHFPKIQFIVTTHSPFICQSADSRGLIRLDAKGAYHLTDEAHREVVNGSIDEATLSELFGLEHSHSSSSEDLRNRLGALDAQLYRGMITEEEKREREKIVQQLPRQGGEVERLLRRVSEG